MGSFFVKQIAAPVGVWHLGVALLASMPVQTPAATIDVFVEPYSQTVNVFETFDITIVADISEPVLGFGFELTYDQQFLELHSTTIGSEFMAVANTGDNLISALAFPSPVSGDGIALASATFSARSAGTAAFDIDVAECDLTQGFAEVDVGSLADFDVEIGFAKAILPSGPGGGGSGVPEAAMLSLLTLGVLLIASWRR